MTAHPEPVASGPSEAAIFRAERIVVGVGCDHCIGIGDEDRDIAERALAAAYAVDEPRIRADERQNVVLVEQPRCKACGGTGKRHSGAADEDYTPCWRCDGTGLVDVNEVAKLREALSNLIITASGMDFQLDQNFGTGNYVEDSIITVARKVLNDT